MAKTKPKPKPIDRARKRDLLTLLDNAHSRELIYIDLLLQSAYASALQVLDKRIEYLEKRAEPRAEESPFIGEFFLDLMIDLLIGGVGGRALRNGMERVLRPVVRSRQAFIVRPSRVARVAPTVALDRDQLRRGRTLATKRLADNFTRIANGEDHAAYRIIPEILQASVLEVASDLSRSRANLPNRPAPRPRPGNTAAVEFVVSTQKFVSDQQWAIDFLYNAIRREVEYQDVSPELASSLESFLIANLSGADDAAQRDKDREGFLFFYEACMWAHVLQARARFEEDYVGQEQLLGTQPANKLMSDRDEYKLTERGEGGVEYQLPENQGNGRYQRKRRKIEISQELLEYLMGRLPDDLDSPGRKSILETAWDQRGSGRPGSERTRFVKVHAYDRLQRLLRRLDGSVDSSFSALAGRGALPGLPRRKPALPR